MPIIRLIDPSILNPALMDSRTKTIELDRPQCNLERNHWMYELQPEPGE